jgi:uncharacterized protein (TIGR03492 family)
MKNILFLSNGYGEDMIAAAIIEEMKKREGFGFKALPLVGEGREYRGANIEMIGPGKELPSGGFSTQGLAHLWKDIKAGLIKLIWGQVKALKKSRESIDLVVCVGDIYVVLLSLLFLRKPIIFLATAKSDYIGEHYGIEKWIMRRWCKLVFTRDEITTLSLRKSGVKALFLGNAMRDCLRIKGEDFGLSEGSLTLGLLPGSREEAYDNLVDILKIAESLKGITPNFLLALAPSLNLERVGERIKKINWELEKVSLEEEEKGIVAKLLPPHHKLEVMVTGGRFGDVLNKSDLLIGLAGTANEQATGLGKPVVTFMGNGPQTTRRRLAEQKRLLGDSLAFVKREEAAVKIEEILRDEAQIKMMARTGRERMGESGGAKKIAGKISESTLLN